MYHPCIGPCGENLGGHLQHSVLVRIRFPPSARLRLQYFPVPSLRQPSLLQTAAGPLLVCPCDPCEWTVAVPLGAPLAVPGKPSTTAQRYLTTRRAATIPPA